MELTDIVINGTAYPLLTSAYEVKGKGEGGNTAKKVVGGAGLGALLSTAVGESSHWLKDQRNYRHLNGH